MRKIVAVLLFGFAFFFFVGNNSQVDAQSCSGKPDFSVVCNSDQPTTLYECQNGQPFSVQTCAVGTQCSESSQNCVSSGATPRCTTTSFPENGPNRRVCTNEQNQPVYECLPGYRSVEGNGGFYFCHANAVPLCGGYSYPAGGLNTVPCVHPISAIEVAQCASGFELDNLQGSVLNCKRIGQTDSAPQPEPIDPNLGSPDDGLVTGEFLYDIDPLNPTSGHQGEGLVNAAQQLLRFITFQSPAGILNTLIPYLFVFAGLILFVMLLWGGFEMLTGAATPKSTEAGKQRITAALIGFILLFISYWIAQIVQFITGVNVLGL